MNFALVSVSIASLRSQPDHKSELTSQLLFGETIQLIHSKGNWHFIQCNSDGHEAWIHQLQFTPISKLQLDNIEKSNQAYSFDLLSNAITNNEHIPVILGSTLPHFDGLSFHHLNKKLIYNGQVLTPNSQLPDGNHLLKIAYKFLNAPYLWGGNTPFGIDAAGLNQMVFRLCGIQLPRKLTEQINLGKTIQLFAQAKQGDIAFFKNDLGIEHTGLLINNQQIMHADGKVVIESLDSHGIFNASEKRYTYKLKLIKRHL